MSDVPGPVMYREVPPGPKTTHGLSKWLSDRPEAALEKYHEYLAHLANTGSNPDLADPLTLGGTAEFNVKQRWKSWLNKKSWSSKILAFLAILKRSHASGIIPVSIT